MLSVHRLLPAAALAFLSTSTLATTVYTSSSAFLAAVAPGAYTETFDGLPDPGPATPSFSGGAFAYTASAPSDVFIGIFPAPYTNGQFLGTSQIDEPLTITFTSGNVHAVGGQFFATDLANQPVAVAVTVTISDGTTRTFTPVDFASAFRGFVSDLAITSLVVGAPGQSLYASLDNLTVGVVPEPTSYALVGLALVGLLASRRRNASDRFARACPGILSSTH